MNLDADRVKDQHEAMAYVVSIPPAAGVAASGGVILWVIGFLTHTGPLIPLEHYVNTTRCLSVDAGCVSI